MERDTHLQGIFTSLLIYSISLSESPNKRVAPMEIDAHSGTLFNISFGVPSKGALPPGPTHGVPLESDAPFLGPSFIHHSKSLVYDPPPPPPDSRFPLEVKGPLWREMPVSRAFLNISSRVPSKGALTRGPPQ